MPQTGVCTEITCTEDLTELYECHCCNWLICLKHLLQHVEVAKKEKNKQLDNLRNDLTSLAYTFELLVERKMQEIERGKELLTRVKAKLDTPECSIEEMQRIFEEVSQAIAGSARDETIVKVEPTVSVCNSEISMEEAVIQEFQLPMRRVLDEISSPAYNARILRSTQSAGSMKSRSIHCATNLDADRFSHIVDDSSSEVTKDEDSVDEKRPGFTKKAAFLLKSKKPKLELYTHLTRTHLIKKVHAQRLCLAVKSNLDPATTRLFNASELVTYRDRLVNCPFNNNTISLIGECPTESRHIPCRVLEFRCSLKQHLQLHHQINTQDADKIIQTYQKKLNAIRALKENRRMSR